MKRYACNLLFVSPSVVLKKQVVEIGSEGLCTVYYTLEHEQPFTEWFGGIFVLLPIDVLPNKNESVRAVWARIVRDNIDTWHVWRISGVNSMNPDIDTPCCWHLLG